MRNRFFIKYWPSALLLFLLSINFIYVLSGVLFFPLKSMDAIGIWLLKAKAFYLEDNFPQSIFFSPVYQYSHPQYPVLLPFLFNLIYKISKTLKELNVLIFYPFLYATILFLVYKTLRNKTTIFFSLLFTYTYSMFSPLLSQAGRVHAGNADIILCLINWLVVYILYHNNWQKNLKRYLWLLVLLAMISSQIKTEGVFLSIIILLLPFSLKKRLLLFILSLVPFFLWQAIIAWFKIPRDLSLTLLPAADLVGKLSLVLGDIASEFSNLRNWYIFWPIFFGSLFLPQKLQKTTKYIFVRYLSFVSILFLLIFIFFPLSADGHISGLIDRVLLQLSPFFFLIFFEKIHLSLPDPFLRGKIHLNFKKAHKTLSTLSFLKKSFFIEETRTRRVSP